MEYVSKERHMFVMPKDKKKRSNLQRKEFEKMMADMKKQTTRDQDGISFNNVRISDDFDELKEKYK